MQIKDLEVSKELASEDLAEVRGGSNVAMVIGAQQLAGNGGFNFASGNMQVAPQTVTQQDTTVDIASVLASAGTLINQTKLA